MVESTFSRRRAPWPWGLLGMLGLVLAVEGFVSRHQIDLITGEAWDWKQASRAVARIGPRDEVLCFGSSVSALGVFPPVIQHQVGKRTFNLAICGGPPPASYFLFRRALAAGAKPSAVLVDFHPGAIGVPVMWHFIRLWPELLTTRDCLELSWSARDPDFLVENLLARHLYSVKDRLRIRAGIMSALRNETVSTRQGNRVFQRQKWINRGAVFQPASSVYGGEVADNYVRDLLPDSWSPDPIAERYVRRFLDLAAEHRIPVFWVIPPFAPALRERREAKGLDAVYTQFVRKMLDRSANLIVLSGLRSGYEVPAFTDAGHLNGPGGIAFSSEVAAALRDRLDGARKGPRWIDLPRYQPWPATVPMEDIAQSIAAVQSSRSPRK